MTEFDDQHHPNPSTAGASLSHPGLASRAWRSFMGLAHFDGSIPNPSEAEKTSTLELSSHRTTPGLTRFGIPFLAVLVIVLRVLYALHYRIDSDEPQHLHVVWAWANGLLPYKDLFDNHAPVFQALCAPLFRVLGVRPDIILPMRLAMLPLFAGTIYCVYRIVATFGTPQTAAWSAGLAALYPKFFFSSLEFRPDQMWAMLWLVVLAILICGQVTVKRAFAAGLILGTAFAVSMKSVLLLASLVTALMITLLVFRQETASPFRWRLLRRCTLAGGLGLVFIPLCVVGIFVALGVGHDMYYCVIEHNMSAGQTDAYGRWKMAARILGWLPVPILGLMLIKRCGLPARLKPRVSLAFLSATFYWIYLVSLWPVLTSEDFLPFFPSAAVIAAPLLIHLGRSLTLLAGLSSPFAIAPWIVVELASILATHSLFTNHTTHKIGMVADTLRLTSETDFVMDSKGETIYRRRPFFYVLERMTFGRLGDGSIDNDIIKRLIETGTPLVTTRRMPREVQTFMQENYVPISVRLRVLGQQLPERKSRALEPVSFVVTIPSRYSFVTPQGPAEGQVDGAVLHGPLELTAGRHEYLPAKISRDPVIFIWSAAIERGYSPFREIERDRITPED